MKLKERLISNTIFTIVGEIFSKFVGFVITPYILYKLGIDRFAVWSIIGAILGYFSKADLGVSTSYVKYISQSYAEKDHENINKIINSGFVYYSLIGTVIYVITYLWRDRVFDLFQLVDPLRSEVSRLFHYAVLINVCSSALEIFDSVLWGIQRADIIKKIRMSVIVVEAVSKIGFLSAGYKLGGLVLTGAICAVLRISANVFFSFKLVPGLRFNPLLFDMQTFRKMFNYGLQLQLSRLAKVCQMHLSKLILAHFLPLSTVAIYDIGNRIAQSVKTLPQMLIPSILPAASQLHTLNSTESLEKLYYRASKYVAISVVFLSGFFLSMMPVVILSWTGTQIDVYHVSLIGRILLVGYSYNLLSNVASIIILGMGHPEYSLRSSMITLITNVLLNLLLISNFGFVGAALATSTAAILGSFYLVIVCHKKLQKSYLYIVKDLYIWPFIAGVIASVNAFLVYKMICVFWFLPQGRLQHMGIIVISGIIFTLSYLTLLLKSGYIDRYDKELFFSYIQKRVEKIAFLRGNRIIRLSK